MDHGSLHALRQRVQRIELNGSLTLEQASSALALNQDVDRFHSAVAQAERLLELAGVIDVRLEHELAARALELTRSRARIALTLASADDIRPLDLRAAARAARADPAASARAAHVLPSQPAPTTRRPME